MNNSDKIARDTKILVDSVKDALTANVVKASQTGLVNISSEDISKLVNIIDMSTSEGYQRALPSFQNSIKKHL